MPVLNHLITEHQAEQPFKGLKMTVCIHLEAKSAYMAKAFRACGAVVTITGSNPLSTQDAIAAALVEDGIEVFGWHGATPDEYSQHIRNALDQGPQLVIDDGGDLITMLHAERRDLLGQVIGGAEETTTGLIRLRAMAEEGALTFPVIAVNDAMCKYMFDNRYGTGQSVWDGIMRTTNLLIAGKTVVVSGFGWCGRGVAMRAAGLGANVIVTEVEPIHALEAVVEGFRVMPMREAAGLGDIFVTTTGCRDIIGEEHIPLLKDGAILSNAGHFDVEINKQALATFGRLSGQPRQNIDEYEMNNGRRIYLLGEGRLVNLAAGDGHPAEIMDLSFALQFGAMLYLLREGKKLPNAVIKLPYEYDQQTASIKLKALGINIDKLSCEQEEYLKHWQGE
jgi:adenosylhomocysteinase